MTRPIPRNLSDKDMAIQLVTRMDPRIKFSTIIQRLSEVEAARNVVGQLARDKVLSPEVATEWLVKLLKIQ